MKNLRKPLSMLLAVLLLVSALPPMASGAYSDAYTELSNGWVAYTRSLLSNATIQLGSLVAS